MAALEEIVTMKVLCPIPTGLAGVKISLHFLSVSMAQYVQPS